MAAIVSKIPATTKKKKKMFIDSFDNFNDTREDLCLSYLTRFRVRVNRSCSMLKS